MISFLHNHCLCLHWKNFENRSIFGEVYWQEYTVSCFLTDGACSTNWRLSRTRLLAVNTLVFLPRFSMEFYGCRLAFAREINIFGNYIRNPQQLWIWRCFALYSEKNDKLRNHVFIYCWPRIRNTKLLC